MLPELSILPTPVALASLLNAVPAFQFQDTNVPELPFSIELEPPNVNPLVSNESTPEAVSSASF